MSIFPVFVEQLMLDKAGREFTVCAGWIGEICDPESDWGVAFDLEECLGDDYGRLLPEAFEDYRALRPKSGQERWEAAHRRPPRHCFECDVMCAWCGETVACIPRAETRANRRDRKAEAAAAAIVRDHMGSCAGIQAMVAAPTGVRRPSRR